MVSLADSQGVKKVYYEDFSKLVRGELISPVGMAFPPTLNMLMSKNIKKEQLQADQLLQLP